MGGKGRLPQHRKVAIGIAWGRQLERDLVALRGEAHIAARGEAPSFRGHAGMGRLPAPTAPQVGKQRIDRLRHRQTQGQHLRPGKVQRGFRHQQAQGGLHPGRPRKHQLRAAQHARQPGAMHRPRATEGHQREVPRSLAATDRHRARHPSRSAACRPGHSGPGLARSPRFPARWQSPRFSTRARLPPPAPISMRSTAGMLAGSPLPFFKCVISTSNWLVSNGGPPSTRHSLAVVPPMSIGSSRRRPGRVRKGRFFRRRTTGRGHL